MTTDVPEVPEGLQYAIVAHAGRLHRQFPMVDREDVLQEQYLWWYSHPRQVRRYLELEDEQLGFRTLSRALRNAGLAHCHRVKARTVGYEVEDLFFYSVGLLRELLPAVYDDDAWLRVGRSQVDDMPRGKSVPSEGNNVIVGLIDVKSAVGRLPSPLRRLLESWVGFGCDDERLALLLETTEDAARMRVNRALKRLQDELGGERPDWAAASHGEIRSSALPTGLLRDDRVVAETGERGGGEGVFTDAD